MHPRLRFLLLAALLAVAALALGDGLSPDLAEAQTSRHQFPGLVVDEDGRPVERLLVAASVQDGQGRYESRVTAAGGGFRLWLVEGSYRLFIWSGAYRKCTVSGIENPEGRPDAVFPVEGEGVTPIRIVVATSERPEAARWVRCHFDVPFYRVQGTVVGPDQQPLAGINVRLWGLSSDHNLGPWTGEGTGPDGAFAIEVPAGSYRLHLRAELEDGGDCVLGNYGADGRRASGDVTRIVVTDEDVLGVLLTLEDVPSRLCHEIEGVVTDAEGNPLADMSLKFLGHGESQIPTTDEAGIFQLRVRKGGVWIPTSGAIAVSKARVHAREEASIGWQGGQRGRSYSSAGLGPPLRTSSAPPRDDHDWIWSRIRNLQGGRAGDEGAEGIRRLRRR